MNLKQAIDFVNGLEDIKDFDKKFAGKRGDIAGVGSDKKIIDKLYDEFLKIPKFKAFTWMQPKKAGKREVIMKFLEVEAGKDEEKLGKEMSDFIQSGFKDKDGKLSDLYVFLAALLYLRRNNNPKAGVLWDTKNDRPSVFLTHLHEEKAAVPTKPEEKTTKPKKGTEKSVEVSEGTVTVVGAVEAFSAGEKEKFQAIVEKADEETRDKIFWNLYTEYIYPGEMKNSKGKTYKDFLLNPKEEKSYKQLITSKAISSKIEEADPKVYEKIRGYAINSTQKWLGMKVDKASTAVTLELLTNLFQAKSAPKQKTGQPKKADIVI